MEYNLKKKNSTLWLLIQLPLKICNQNIKNQIIAPMVSPNKIAHIIDNSLIA
jgi:hypothetical protein